MFAGFKAPTRSCWCLYSPCSDVTHRLQYKHEEVWTSLKILFFFFSLSFFSSPHSSCHFHSPQGGNVLSTQTGREGMGHCPQGAWERAEGGEQAPCNQEGSSKPLPTEQGLHRQSWGLPSGLEGSGRAVPWDIPRQEQGTHPVFYAEPNAWQAVGEV